MRFRMVGTFATDIGILLLGLIGGVLAARLLHPEGRGALAAILFWPQILAGIGLLSMGEAATYRIGVRPERSALIRTSCFWLALALSVATVLVGYLLIPFFLGDAHAHLWELSRIYLLYVPFNFVALSLLATDQGQLQYARFNVLRLLVPLIYLIFVLGLWATDNVSVGWFVAANVAATIIVTFLRVGFHRALIGSRPSWEEARVLLGLSFRFHPATVLLLLASQADLYVVLALGDDSATGLYVIALTMATSGLSLVSGVYQKVLFPHIATTKDRNGQVRLLARGVRHATLLLVLITAPLGVLMPWLVPALFGAAFNDAVGPALVLLLAYIFVGLKVIIIQSLRGLGEGHLGSIAAAVGLGIFLVIAWPLGSSLGLVGIAAATGLANLAALGLLAYHLRKKFDLRLTDWWGLNPRTFTEVREAVGRLNPFVVKAP